MAKTAACPDSGHQYGPKENLSSVHLAVYEWFIYRLTCLHLGKIATFPDSGHQSTLYDYGSTENLSSVHLAACEWCIYRLTCRHLGKTAACPDSGHQSALCDSMDLRRILAVCGGKLEIYLGCA